LIRLDRNRSSPQVWVHRQIDDRKTGFSKCRPKPWIGIFLETKHGSKTVVQQPSPGEHILNPNSETCSHQGKGQVVRICRKVGEGYI
jgi:hypothetical protein